MPLDPFIPPALTPEGRTTEHIAALERRLRTIESYLNGGAVQQLPLVASLGVAGRAGRVKVLASDNNLYLDNGVSWVAQRQGSGELAYNQFVGNFNVNALSEGAATTIVTASAVTFDGINPVYIEFFSPEVVPITANTLTITLHDDTAAISLGQLANEAGVTRTAVMASRRLTPVAGLRTYSIRAFTGSAGATVNGGAGGSGNDVPGFIRIFQP